MLPNFIIVGTPKAGTTSLYHYLEEHPDIFMSTPKEVNYFSKEEIEAQNLYYNDTKIATCKEYEALFKQAKPTQITGEASVSYLFYPNTPTKIKALLPDVKIIILLRNPIDRGFSHYLMDYKLGLVSIDYMDIIHQNIEHKHSKLYYQQYIELGMYYEQVKRYITIFGKEKIKIYMQKEFKENREKVLKDVYTFLNVDNTFIADFEQKHNEFSMPKNRVIHHLYKFPILRKLSKEIFSTSIKNQIKNIFFEKKRRPTLDKKDRSILVNIYKEDIIKLERLLEINLSHWYSDA